MALPLTAIPDDTLRTRLRHAADLRMTTSDRFERALAGQECLEVIAELKRRRVPLWRGPVDCACGCGDRVGQDGWAGESLLPA